MADRRLVPLFGINVTTSARGRERAFAAARVADEGGLDLVTASDHPYNPATLDTWTLLTALGVATRRVRLMPNVTPLPLRPPAMLAKTAATLDLLTWGRVELGLGAGGFWDGIASYGGPRRTPGEAVEALEEGIGILRALWQESTAGPVSIDGRHYHLADAQPGPAPTRPIGIWLGALGPRMVRLTGRLADGWIVSTPYIPPDQLPPLQEAIDEAAIAAGRRPEQVRRGYNLAGVVLAPHAPNTRPARPGVIVGAAGRWIEEIVRFYHDLRMDTFIFSPAGGDEEEQLRAFIEEVIPGVRSALVTTGPSPAE